MAENKSETLYSISLGDAYKVSRDKRAGRAASLIKGFVARHLKSGEMNVRLSTALNNLLWSHGAANPTRSVKVKASREGEKIVIRLPEEKTEEQKKAEVKKEEKKPEAKKDEKKAETAASKDAEKKPENKPEAKAETGKVQKMESKPVAAPKAKEKEAK